jgi:hypothetical protein
MLGSTSTATATATATAAATTLSLQPQSRTDGDSFWEPDRSVISYYVQGTRLEAVLDQADNA